MKESSITTSKYEGWIVSILLHAFLSILFLFIVYDKPIDISEYANLTFSNVSETSFPVLEEKAVPTSTPTPALPTAPRSSKAATSSNTYTATRKVDLPTRRMTEHDIERIPIENQGNLGSTGKMDKLDTERETIHGINDNISTLNDELLNAAKPGNNPSDKSVGQKVDAISLPGNKGGDIKFDRPYDIAWQGVVRDVLNDPLPVIAGFDQEATIKVKITVLPDGTIGDVIPLQKADVMLESASIKALKLWRLSALKPSDLQVNQTATITFKFELQ